MPATFRMLGTHALRFVIIILVATCGSEEHSGLRLGQKFAGGYIFYLDATGEHGLVAAPPPDTFVSFPWGCLFNTIDGADSGALGAGNQNTLDILLGCVDTNTAANYCANLVVDGYSDWFLPSRLEWGQNFNTGQPLSTQRKDLIQLVRAARAF
jgi:hypothetical protein